MDGHVVIAGKHVHRSIRHLHVDIRVPRHDLSDNVRRYITTWFGGAYFTVPPPAQERTMYDPCFCAYIRHGKEVGLHEEGKVCFLFFVGEGAVGESREDQWSSFALLSRALSYRPS